MALAKDEATSGGRGRGVDKAYPDSGLVVYRSDFDAGFDNWTDHWDGYRPWPILSLTDHAAHRGSKSLMLSTGEHANPPAGDVSSVTAAFKRMGTYRDYRYHTFSGFFALGIGSYTGTWAQWGVMFDIQEQDDSHRSFFKFMCEARPSPDYTRWQIRPDAGDSAMINIPTSTKKWMGDNDNKSGFGYVSATIDKHANGGLGGYHSLQVNEWVSDLRGLGGGSAHEPNQDDGTNSITQFNGGANIGLYLSRKTDQAGGAQLYANDIVYSVSNVAPPTA